MPLRVPRPAFLFWAFAALGCLPTLGIADDEGKSFSQKPEVAPSRVRGESGAPTTGTSALEALGKGPVPTWIWGKDENKNDSLVVEFTLGGAAKSAWIKAAADNSATVFINGKAVGSGDSWQEPVEVDVTSSLKPGKNEIRAEVANAGGPAAFAFKLAATLANGSTQYVVSDGSWKATNGPTRTLGQMGIAPWGDVFAGSGGSSKSPRGVFEVPAGFQVEKMFTVPKETLGSWVSITFDDKGRLIASDQDGKGLCRITPSPKIGSDQPTKVEPLGIKITAAQGMLYAFGHLYLSVNGGPGSGFYRATDTNGDDQFDKLEKLATFRGGGEHGPHALRLSPDGQVDLRRRRQPHLAARAD